MLFGLDFQTVVQPECLILFSAFEPVLFCFQGDYCTEGQRVGLCCRIRENIEVDSVVYKATLHGKILLWLLRYLGTRKFFLLVQIKN